MKHIIKRIEYLTNGSRRYERVSIEVEDIEIYRKQLYEREKCDAIYLTYETIN